MRKIVNYLVYSILILPLVCQAESPPLKPVHSGNKQDWLAKMQHDLPGVLCQPDHYFVECFNTTEQECTEVTSLYVKACLNNVVLALPAELTAEQGEYWGQMVGRCSYDLYEKFMAGKKRNLAKCQAQPSAKDDLPKPSQAIP